MKILIAYDGSPQSDIALRDLQRAGLPTDVDAVVLTVADARILTREGKKASLSRPKKQISAIDASASATFLMEEALAIAEAGRYRLQAAFPNWTVQAQVSAGLPAWEIFWKSEHLRSGLVVLGASICPPTEHTLLGHVTHTVLTRLFCSLRVGRNHVADPQQPLRLLVGIDGSRGAENAAKVVAQRVWPAYSEVRLVVGIEPVHFSSLASTLVLHSAVIQEQVQSNQLHLEQLVRATAEMIARHNPTLAISVSVKVGDPKSVLLTEAERWGADCIFLGARGQSWSVQPMLGKVVSAVVTHANCSVEIVRNRQTMLSTVADDVRY
jgi:nucleotide-binding universal stress UspA family protein